MRSDPCLPGNMLADEAWDSFRGLDGLAEQESNIIRVILNLVRVMESCFIS